ncbi:MAG: hypothetical protein F4X81_03885 [Gammaproteobacteria bacterium]|nr:hypothetical protein [Gammaproteobacteria bacterium]MYE50592.1 hypothetical protein [Gammaproteobacteria bacterium]
MRTTATALAASLSLACLFPASGAGQVGIDVHVSDHPDYKAPWNPATQQGMDPISASLFADSTALLTGLPSCCESFDQLAYTQLPTRKKVKLHHGSPDTVMATPFGKSYVTALTLPAKRRRNRLQVTSVIDHQPPTVGMLPRLLFLGANGQPIENDGSVKTDQGRAGGERVRAEIPEGAVRALVVTDERSVGTERVKCTEVGGSMVMVGQNTFVPTPGQIQCWRYPLGVVGAIEARLVR